MGALINNLLALAGGFFVGLIAAIAGANLTLAMGIGLVATLVLAGILWLVERRRGQRRKGDRRQEPGQAPPVVQVSGQGVASL